MAEAIGAARHVPTAVSIQLHRDVRPHRRPEPSLGVYDPPWLDGHASFASLRTLVRILDPLVLLANLGGYAVTEIVVAADPGRSNKVLGLTLPECLVGQVYRDPEAVTDTCWRVYAGIDFPPGASFALGLRMEIARVLGTVYYDPGVAIDFADPSVILPAELAEETNRFDRMLLLSSPDAVHLDDWLPALGDIVADDDGLRARLIADLVAAAHGVATATERVVPAGQLGLYAPSRWRPPRRDTSDEELGEYLDPFIALGYAMVEHVLPDPEALGRFLVEETRLSRRALKDAGGPGAASRLSMRSRIREIDRVRTGRPTLTSLARRCEQETRRESPDPLVALETWTVPRPGMRSIDLRLSYTEWLLVATQLGAIDPISAIGVAAAVADPANSRGLHPWLPGGLSRHATQIRGLASDAWMAWESDRVSATGSLSRILTLLPLEPPTFELAYAGMPDTQLTQDFPGLQSWDGTELEDARAMLQELIGDEGSLDAEGMLERLRELETVLPALDEYWLQTEPKKGPLDELLDLSVEFGEGFAVGFLIPFTGDPLETATRLRDLHVINAPYLPLLSNVIVAGALFGAAEYVVSTINELFDWVLGDAVEQAVQAIAEMLASSAWELGTLFGESTGIMAKGAADKLLGAVAPGWYAFELGRLLGPLLLDVVLGAVFSAYVVPRLAGAAALVLRGTVEQLDSVVNLRRVWSPPDADDLPGDGVPGDADGGGDGNGNGNGNGNDDDDDAPDPLPPFDPFDRLAEIMRSPARAAWLRTGLSTSSAARLVAALADPTKTETLMHGLRVVSDLTTEDGVFQTVIRAYTTSNVKLGIPETLGRVTVKATAESAARPLTAADFEFSEPPPTAAAIQDEVLEVIARHADSYEELNEVSSPMGSARNGNDKDRLQDIWLRNKQDLGRRRIGDWGLDTDLWDNGRTMPVSRPRGQPRTEGRVRATRMNADDNSHPEQVEGWLSRTSGDDLPGAVAREVRSTATIEYPKNASHLFPKSLGGPPELWNLIATSARFNTSWMAVTENSIRALFKQHGELYLRVDLTWGAGDLPTSITYRAYKIGDHGGPELVLTEVIGDVNPQVRLPLGKDTDYVQPRLNADIIETWFPWIARVTGET